MIVACLKWVSHPGEPDDERFARMSPADRAALELALRQAEAMADTVTAITVGPAAADRVLREAHAAGARRLVRIDTADDPLALLGSDAVAAAIGATIRSLSDEGNSADALWAWCGDYSLDRGSGSVPAFLAGALGARQALGCIAIEPHGHGTLHAVRRLDGGRRELLEVQAPAVVSVEGSVTQLRRSSLASVRAASAAYIEVHPLIRTGDGAPATTAPMVRPYRPRARALAAPAGASTLDRLRVLTDAAAAGAARGETVELPPDEAAARIVRALDEWGYLRAARQ
ncbi:MAG: mycofactocin-associated electron transfer flavoprotein beta subunit [Ilumatobacteraceae bacterium]